MSAKRRWILLGLGLITLLAAASTANPQSGITAVRDSAFETRTRPPVPFDHDGHNEKAGLFDCNICHHIYEDGKRLDYEASIGMECSSCHMDRSGAGVMDVIRAYHLQCRGCHLENAAGPVWCSQCHHERASAASQESR
jgi:hypothetical protein